MAGSLLGSNAAEAQMAAAGRRLQRKIRWPRVEKREQTDAGPAASLVLEEETRGNNHNAQTL
jgi:hypothetical protein